jgi:hypothetical protein
MLTYDWIPCIFSFSPSREWIFANIMKLTVVSIVVSETHDREVRCSRRFNPFRFLIREDKLSPVTGTYLETYLCARQTESLFQWKAIGLAQEGPGFRFPPSHPQAFDIVRGGCFGWTAPLSTRRCNVHMPDAWSRYCSLRPAAAEVNFTSANVLSRADNAPDAEPSIFSAPRGRSQPRSHVVQDVTPISSGPWVSGRTGLIRGESR